jgi:hypothetical protein
VNLQERANGVGMMSVEERGNYERKGWGMIGYSSPSLEDELKRLEPWLACSQFL